MLDAELTINRPDCLGHYGFAREVAALERRLLRPIKLAAGAARGSRRVQRRFAPASRLKAPNLCGRYTARIVRGVKVQPSPPWLRQRLEALGQASINNIVDATNYVMLELGQPLHAFDLARVVDRRIVVRRAHAGEKIRTLDGLERVLSPEICVIADAAHAVAIAGVMGGAESEISSATHDVLLESAWFDPISIRRASKHLNLRTEASVRFERGADPEMADAASRRCASLLVELAGGEILPGAVDLYPGHREPLHLALSRAELLRVMGADVPDSEIEAILSALGFLPRRLELTAHELAVAVTANIGATPEFARHSRAVWACTQPSWRQDVTREVDLIEEVARHFGLEKFPPRLHGSRQPAARLPHAEAEDRLRERLIGLGYHEIVTIPLVNAEEDALFRPAGVIDPAVIANPLGRRRLAAAFHGLGEHGARARVEYQSRSAQRAPVRDWPRVFHARRCARGEAHPHHRRDGAGPREKRRGIRTRVRIRRPQRRSRPDRRARRRLHLARDRARTPGRHAAQAGRISLPNAWYSADRLAQMATGS